MNHPPPRWFDHRRLVTFGDTCAAGSVYFAHYLRWQGECREAMLAHFYPEFADEFRRGFLLVTEFANLDFFHEAALFDELVIRATVTALSRSRIEFAFECVRVHDNLLLCRGRQAVVWINAQRHPSLMPDKLYDATAAYFGVGC